MIIVKHPKLQYLSFTGRFTREAHPTQAALLFSCSGDLWVWGYSQIDRLKELLLAAERGDAEAQFELGLMYDEGYGVSRDNQEAAKWYSKAAEQGDDSGTDR